MLPSVLKRLRYAFALLALLGAAPVGAQSTTESVAAQTFDLPPTLPTEYNGDVRNLPPDYTPRPYVMLNEFEPPPNRKLGPAQPHAPEGPNNVPLAPMPAAAMNFAGLAFGTSVTGGQAGGGWPPDTNGDVGPTLYVQAVNLAFGIFDKSKGTLTAGFTENSLWNASGLATSHPCRSHNQGDPIVLHDALNDRWILTDFGFALDGSGNPMSPFYECIAVSKSSDPVAGGWWFYAVRMDAGNVPANTFADYPKFGLWGDGCLYMGANGFDATTGSYAGAVFASFNTTNMYAGAALTSSVGFLTADANGDPFGMFPANALGTSAASMPPAGTPEYFVDEPQTDFKWAVRKFTKGLNCGGGGTLSTATSVSQTTYGIPAILVSGSYTFDMVQQKGTSNRLDSLGDRMMQKIQYRRIGSAESLWAVHTTCGTGHDANFACANSTSPTQPQWAQINVTGKTIVTTPVQQQIYAPDTTKSRWMGSLAVDASGDMALGYSTSCSGTSCTSPNTFPSIAYSGRLVNDTVNQLPQSETQLVAGAGSQNICGVSSCSRWGDYSAMSVDPVDDCTFWYTNEYYDTNAHASNGSWATRIGSFRFPSCIGPASQLVVTQEPNASYASNATITLKVSVEDAVGNVVTGDTSAITLTLQGGTAGATLGGTTTVNAVAGVATFSNLTVDKVGTGYSLHATDASLTAADSTSFNITAGAASKLVFTAQPPASSQSNSAFGATVTVEDAAGNTVTSGSSTVALTLSGGTAGAVLTGGSQGTVNGVATFTNLKVDKVGTNYHLHAADGSLTTADSSNFNITAGPAAAVTFTTQPALSANVVAGTAIPLTAHVADAAGNAVSGQSIQLAIGTNPGSSTLSITANPVSSDSSGNAMFTNVSLNKSGTGYTLTATDNTTPAATHATSNAFNIIAGTPASIAFTTQPTPSSNIAAGTTIPLVAQVEDNLGNAVAGDDVTLTIANNAGGGTLTVATNPVTTDGAGNATFANVSLDKIGTGYTLKATDANSVYVTSNAFNIVAGAPAQLVFTTQPTDVTLGATLNAIAVTEEDAFGNPLTSDSSTSVDFAVSACGGAALGSAPMSNGVATMSSGQVFTQLHGGLTVSANDASLGISGLSQKFNVGPGDLLFYDGFEVCAL